jgi:hypothetical protein
MDFETAEIQAGYLNEILTEYLGSITYKVFALWNTQYVKEYQTVLIPTKYKNQYDAANESVQLAFARVSIQALVLPYGTADELVSNFDSKATSDEELNTYLNKKP